MEKEFDQIKYQNKYKKEHYDVINITLRKGDKEKIIEQTKLKGFKNPSQYIRNLIENDISKNAWGGVIDKKSCLFIIYPQPRFSKVLAQGQARQPKKIYPSPYMTQVRGKDSPNHRQAL